MKRIPIIEMVNISKRFPGVVANDQINFRVYPGEIHALLGENGAGKSTLMSILAGLYRPDSGYVKVHREPINLKSPRNALEAGIGMIYQHFRLVKNFTVAENIILGAPDASLRIKKQQVEQEVKELSEKYGLGVNPAAKINQLSLGEQQRVEILKMLYRGCEVLIMDEPTTVLTPSEVTDLFNILRLMSEQGKAVVLITHKLHEVMEIADYVTILRRGKVVGEDRKDNLNEIMMTNMMVAREVEHIKIDRNQSPGEEVLAVENLSVRSSQGYMAVKGVNLNLNQGEILAIAGVAGNGQKELVEAMAGLIKPVEGSIKIDNQDISETSVSERLALGINLVPEDRLGTGLVPNLNVKDNAILRNFADKEFSKFGFLNHKKISNYTKELVRDYNIFLSSINHPINYMSGGNLQKLLLGREISQKPRVLLAAYPVRGLDVAAAESVFNIFLEQRNKGTAVLLVLEDLDDIFRLADRVAVMYDGYIKAILDINDVDIETIGALMLGAENAEVANG